MSKDVRYFNFPIQLLSGFLRDRVDCLQKIVRYCVYAHAVEKLEEGTLEERIEDSAAYLFVSLGSTKTTLKHGQEIYGDILLGKVKVGLRTDTLWDFKENPKTEFEEVCLLAYLGLKSIVQKKSYCKVTNMFLLSRMDGWSSTVSEKELSEEIKKYNNEYQLKKIKAELMENWGLIHYGRYTRGFYVSFKMKLEDLVYEVEKKRKKRKTMKQKSQTKIAIEKAMQRLELETTSES